MSYTKTTWSNGDVISAGKLNNLEDGTEANDLEISNLKSDLGDLSDLISGLQTQNITDAGGYFSTDTVEAALQQLGASVDGVETLLAAI